MKNFLRQLLEQFTLGALVGGAVASVLIAGLVRLGSLAYGVVVQDELLFWVTSPVLVFVILASISVLLRQNSLPELSIGIETYSFGTMKKADTGKAFNVVSIVAFIRNRGAPTSVPFIQLTARPLGGLVFTGGLVGVTGEIEASHPGGTVETLRESESLIEKALREPIPRGGFIRGPMVYAFEGALLDALKAAGTTYELAVKDVWGRETKFSHILGGDQVEPREFPQMKRRLAHGSEKGKDA